MFSRTVLIVGAVIGVALAGRAFADNPPSIDASQPTPIVYPLTAQRAGEEGTVLVNVFVTGRGKPQTANVAKSCGNPDLDNAAVESALNAHYLPAIRDGETTSGWLTVQIVYKLPPQASGAPAK
jgi:periplasmic protein TonB